MITKLGKPVILFLLAIVIAQQVPNHLSVDPEIEPYVKRIEALSEGKIKGISYIGFGKPTKDALATCYRRVTNYITIDKEHWDKLSDKSKVLLMAHELHHCSNDGEHVDGLDKYGCPEHFMHFQMGSRFCDSINFSKYVKQMQEI